MKSVVLLLGAFGGLVAAAAGQTNRTDILKELPPNSRARIERNFTFAPASEHHLFGLAVRYDGAVPDLIRASKAAPAVGLPPALAQNQEFPNLRRNPVTGKADGISLFTIKF